MATDSDAARRTSARSPKALAVVALLGGALLAALLATPSAGTVPGLASPDPAVRLGLPVARVLLDVAALATAGLSLLPRLLTGARPSRTGPVLLAARRTAAGTALAWMLFALLSLVLQAAELSPGRPVSAELIADYVGTVPAGAGLLASAIAGLLCAGLALAAVHRPTWVSADLALVVALLGHLPIPLTGHATDARLHQLGTLAVELHVLGAAVWTGGLLAVVLFVAPRRGLLAEAMPRFSRIATAALLVVGASGLVNALLELLAVPGAGLTGLVTTGYGRIALVKVGCLLVLAAIAARLRFRLLPRIARHRPTALVGWATAEIAVMGVAYGLGSVLARSPVVL
ncbi:copper resistance D family protein [Saccharopolyspora cebuensis]|uniref:Copper resistance D family protein n=1 Tax=Saccharopolyspora cebuensis TaxID=418759 RepID=A0ABV4CIS4_9PSEU